MLNDDLQALDYEFNYGGKMHLDTYHARRAEILAKEEREAAAEPAAQFVRMSSMKSILSGVGRILLRTVNQKMGPLESRIEALEKRLGESSSAPATWAMDDIARGLSRLERTMSQPTVPIYDGVTGKLIAARRVQSLEDQSGENR